MYELCQLISQKVLNQEELYCSVLKKSRSATKMYAIKNEDFHLKNSK